MTREEAIKRIKHHKIVHKMDEPNAIKISEALDMAIEALSADAVQVVRCSECKHLHPSGKCEEFADDGIRPSATDYCSYGERKGGGLE